MKTEYVTKDQVFKLIEQAGKFDPDSDYYVDEILNDLRLWVYMLSPADVVPREVR